MKYIAILLLAGLVGLTQGCTSMGQPSLYNDYGLDQACRETVDPVTREPTEGCKDTVSPRWSTRDRER